MSDQEKKKMLRIWFIVAVAIAVLAFSKGNVIAGAIASLIALLSRAMPLIRFVPLFKSLFSTQATANNQTHQQTSGNATKSAMDKHEAAEILGVDILATDEEIISAHKRLMQKVHPDKGGSDALARQINLAKDTLLEKDR